MSLELESLLQGSSFSADVQKRILEFYKIMLEGNESQNLTRLVTPEAFYFDNVCDVEHLLASHLIEYPAVDLGSGAGIPGILAVLIQNNQWVLAESEKMKADYLEKAVNSLHLEGSVRVASERVEKFLQNQSVSSIVARAVGPVDRIYSWIRNCSTWNNLVLMKGPGWIAEWEKFKKTKYRNELEIAAQYSYELGPERKKRVIIKLTRTQ